MPSTTEAVTPITTAVESVTVAAKKSQFEELKNYLNVLQVAHGTKDRRLVSRVLHNLPTIRRSLTPKIISKLLDLSPIKDALQITPAIQSALQSIPSGCEEVEGQATGDEIEVQVTEEVLPERTALVLLIIAVYLLDRAGPSCLQASMEASTLAIMLLQGHQGTNGSSAGNGHYTTFDPLLARSYYFLARAYELAASLPALHNFMMAGLRTAALNHDQETEATIYNLILRLFLNSADYEAAEVFLKNSPFPQQGASAFNNQLVRFHFYRAQVLAHRGKYAEGVEDLAQVVRKAPHGVAARNFVLLATKLEFVLKLLRGDIPERSAFHLHQRALQPYLELTQSVRMGDLTTFQQVVNRHAAIWTQDSTKALIERLPESVLRVGLRRLSQAYLRISFQDIAKKLGLGSEAQARDLVQKALVEGVLIAIINEQLNCMESQPANNLYSTRIPQESFSSRTAVLQARHNEAVRAMRFPEKSSAAVSENDDRRQTESELMDEYMDADDDLF